jgi:O-acetyl-ADP-ribose deacetylase (regulator of RNase III)
MIEYRNGDLFKHKHQLIAHGVNCQGVMASGFAKALREVYPKAYTDYLNVYNEKCAHDGSKTGLLGSFVPCAMDDGTWVAHCFTQYWYGRMPNHQYVSYDAIDRCMKTLNSFMETQFIANVSMPQIGAGLGGGDWNVISSIIEKRLKSKNVQVYVL